MVAKEIISWEEYQFFMNDVSTVGTNMNHDFNVLTKMEFLEKYGHLRPGTYDITSKRYDEAPDLYFNWEVEKEKSFQQCQKFSLTMEQLHKLTDILKENGLKGNVLEILDFIKIVIEGREYGKFVFTKNLSKILQMIEKLGESCGLSREECAFINVKTLQELYINASNVKDVLLNTAKSGRQSYTMTKAITLPPLIIDEKEVWSFYYPDTEPNYITLKSVIGKVISLENNKLNDEIEGKILLISSADPGYDWIFSHKIKGFITKYGGANSHMAIRAGELGVPAVVGIGTKRFEQYRIAEYIEINCQEKNIRVMR